MSTPAAPPSSTTPPPNERARNGGIDALRAATTLLVVLHHTALTYGGIGAWFYREIAPGRTPSSLLLTLFCAVNQAWFMGLFFLLAGYYTPGALQARGPVRYLRDRGLRLGLPLLLFGFVIGPATIALAQTADGKPFGAVLGRLWARQVFEPGPLWFAWALGLFALGAAGWQAVVGRGAPITADATRQFPGHRALACGAVATGVVAFGLRLEWPVGVNVLALQLGYFASYVVLFVFGCMAAGPRWLERLPPERVRTWRRVAWVTLPWLPVAGLLPHAGRAEGGGSVLAALYALWEPLLAWGVILGLLLACQRRFAVLGPIWQRLARRAFAIYVIHPPVLVATALAWREVAAPALLKFAVTGSVACGLCYLIAGWLLRLPGAKRVL